MMFVLSKLLSGITQPLFWLALWWVVALLLLRRRQRAAVAMLWGGLALLGVLGFRAIPDALLRPLENRYAVPVADQLDQYAGVIVLGGAVGPSRVYRSRGQVPLGDAAERMTVPVSLLRSHPQMQLVFSGGEGLLLTTGITESELALAFYKEQGVDASRIRVESGSRNTQENALQVARLLGEQCKQPWLLVTSAWHMPRSMAEFEATGCRITPYPVDYRTGEHTSWTEYSVSDSLVHWQMALHEWVGLAVQRIRR